MRDAVGTAATAVLRLYEERGPAELGLPAVLRRGPRCPSLADVLEGLQDVERHYRRLYPAGGLWATLGGLFSACCPYRVRRYLECKLLLQRLGLDSLADVEALPQSWERILERYREDDVVKGNSGYCDPGFSQGTGLAVLVSGAVGDPAQSL